MNTGRTRFKKGQPKPKNAFSFYKGYKQSEQHKKNIGKANRGHHSLNEFKKGHMGYKGMLGKKWSKNSIEKMKVKMKKLWQNPEYRKRMIEKHMGQNMGELNGFWKGGITPEVRKIRASISYKLWRKSIFLRDNFTCQKYGTRGGRLIAHHINNFADFPELRLAIDNGITLSEKAHKEFHKIYGNNNTKEQLEEFLTN